MSACEKILIAVLLLAQVAFCQKPLEGKACAFHCSLNSKGQLIVDKTYFGHAGSVLGEQLDKEVIKKVIADILKGPGNLDGVIVVLREKNMVLPEQDPFVRKLLEKAKASSFVFYPVKKNHLLLEGGNRLKIPPKHRPKEDKNKEGDGRNI